MTTAREDDANMAMQREQDLITRLESVLDKFVPRSEYAADRDRQDKVLERLTDSIDRLNERLDRLPSQREWDTLIERVDRMEKRQTQGQRFQVSALIQQNKALVGFVSGAILVLLGAYLQGHLRIQ